MTKLRKKHKVIMGNCMSKRLKRLADIRREDIPCGVFISKVLEQICKNISKKTGLIIMEAISEAFPSSTHRPCCITNSDGGIYFHWSINHAYFDIRLMHEIPINTMLISQNNT